MKNFQSTLWQYILDENKNVVATKDYDLIEEFLKSEKRIIRQTYIQDKMISTVFLAIDHDYNWDRRLIRWNEDKPNPIPIVFETMIHCDKKGWLGYQNRYRTYKEAYSGHREAVRFVIKNIREGNDIK